MIYTFYSYKGGVGRSMALVNVAELIYRAGLNVIMVDWDLEAPGLEKFYPDLSEQVLSSPGIIDLLVSYKEKAIRYRPDSQEPLLAAGDVTSLLIDMHPDADEPGQLRLLPAGMRANERFLEYANRVKTFDWQDFYHNWEGEVYFEWLRNQLLGAADVVLIDSRTGVTEMGGVCTYQLADVVVMLCAPNAQNIDGTLQMLSSFTDTRLTDLRHGRKLVPLVIPARVERVSELTKLNTFRQEFTSRFQRHLPADLQDDPDAFIRFEIPYVPLYAFEEIVAVDQSTTKQRAVEMELAYSSILLAMANLAASDSVLKTQLGPRLSELVEADTLRMSQEQARIEQIQWLTALGDYAKAYALSEQGQAAAVSQQSVRSFSGLRSDIASRWVQQMLERYRAAIEENLGDDALRPLVVEIGRLANLELPLTVDLARDLTRAQEESRRRLRYLETWQQIAKQREQGRLLEALRLATSAYEMSEPEDSKQIEDLIESLQSDLLRYQQAEKAIDTARKLTQQGQFEAAVTELSRLEISPWLENDFRKLLALLTPLAQAEASQMREDWRQALALYRGVEDTNVELSRVLAQRIEQCQAMLISRLKSQVTDALQATPPNTTFAAEQLNLADQEGWYSPRSRAEADVAQLHHELRAHQLMLDAVAMLEESPRRPKEAMACLVEANQHALSDYSARRVQEGRQLVQIADRIDKAVDRQDETELKAAWSMLGSLNTPLAPPLLLANLKRELEMALEDVERKKQRKKAEDLVARGLKWLEEDDFGTAASCFQQALDVYPESDVARNGRIQALRKAGEYSERAGEYDVAASHYEDLLRLDPQNSVVQRRLTNLQQRLDQERSELRRRKRRLYLGILFAAYLMVILTGGLLFLTNRFTDISLIANPTVTSTATSTVTSTATNTPTATVTPTSTPFPSPTESDPLAGVPEPFLGQTRTETTVYSSATGDSVVGSLSPSTTVNLCALAGTRYLISLGPCDLSEPLGWVDVFAIQSLSSLPFPAELVTPMPSATPTVTPSPTSTSVVTPTVVTTPTP